MPVHHPFDAVDLLLNRRRDCVGYDLCVRAGIADRDRIRSAVNLCDFESVNCRGEPAGKSSTLIIVFRQPFAYSVRLIFPKVMLAMTSQDALEIRELPRPVELQPAELPTIPGGWTEREWAIEGHSFRLTLPALPDAFLEDPDVHAAFDRDEYMPYWAFLWPAALKMVTLILKSDWPAGAEVLEIGAGIGIVGLAGLARGLKVTISDYEPKAVELALYNARRNDLSGATGMVLDWRTPPAKQFPILWGCELLYEDRHHEPLLDLTRKMLTPDGVAWFVDGGRVRAQRFCELVSQYGLRATLFDEQYQPLTAPLVGRFQLIEVRHRKN